MATLKELNIKLALEAKDLQAQMRKAANDLRREGRNFGQIGSELSMAVSLPLLGIGASALKAAGDMESFRMGFNTTMKAAGRSAEDATKELAALREVAKMPGIDFEGAIKGSMRLQGVGMDAERARKIIAELANGISMAGGTAQDLDGVTRQLAQMAGKGKVMQQDLNIMLENMPMLAKVLKDTFGATTADGLRDMGVNADKFITGITEGLSKLERVPGGLQNSMVNFGVEVKLALGTVGEAINKAFNVTGKLEDFAAWISGAATSFSHLSEGTQKAIVATLGFVAALGPAIKAISIYKNSKAALVDLGRDTVKMFSNLSGSILEATAKFQAMDKVTKLTTIGLIVTAIGAAVLVWQHYADKISEAEAATIRVNKVISDTQTEITKEKIISDGLFKTLGDLSKSTDERSKALETLKSKYPQYLEGMTLEKLSLRDIETAQKRVNDEIIRSTALRMKAAAQDDVAMRIAQKMTRITQLKNGAKVNPSEVKQVDAFELADQGWDIRKSAIWQANEDLKLLNKELQDIENQFESTFGVVKRNESVVSSDMLDRYYNPDKYAKTKEPSSTDKGNDKKSKSVKNKAAFEGFENVKQGLVIINDQAILTNGELNKLSTTIGTVLPESNNALAVSQSYLALKFYEARDAALAQEAAVAKVAARMQTIGELGQAVGNAIMQASEDGAASFKDLAKAGAKAAKSFVAQQIAMGVAAQVRAALGTGLAGLILAPIAGAAAFAVFNKVIPKFAKGVYADKPTLGVFGEAGPEYVLPEKKLHGVMRDMANLPSRNNGTMTIEITGSLRGTGQELLGVVEKAQVTKWRSFGR